MDRYLEKLIKKSDKEFLFSISVQAIIIDTILIIILLMILSFIFIYEIMNNELYTFLFGEDEKSWSILDLFLRSTVGPILETLLFQVPIVYTLRMFTTDKKSVIILTTVIFSSFHIINGYIALFLTVPGSFFIATTYVLYIEESFKKAFWYTSLVHGIANAYVWLLAYFGLLITESL